jgi:hypothetical protein
MASALVLTTLSGCATSGSKTTAPTTTLAPVPSDMDACFSRFVPKPPKGQPSTKQQAYNLIGALKRSELEKSQCGKRLIQFYEAQMGPLQ